MKIRFPKTPKTLVILLALAGLATAVYGIVSVPPYPEETVNFTATYVEGQVSLDPNDPVWRQVSYVEKVLPQIYRIPIRIYPPYQGSRNISVKAVHNGEDIFFNIRWNDATKDSSIDDVSQFADSVALSVPYSGIGNDPNNASQLDDMHMGEIDNPVNIIYWRADLPKPQNIVGAGKGTVQKTKDSDVLPIRSSSSWTGNNWTVIITRPLNPASDNMTALERGRTYSISWATWDGAVRERSGNKFANENLWDNIKIE